jgi:hypothetical protein
MAVSDALITSCRARRCLITRFATSEAPKARSCAGFALDYPVFVGRQNANFAETVDLSKSTLFREMLEVLLLPRLLAAPRALIIPLGDSAGSGVRYLVQFRQVDERRVLFGLPHPSGSNGHRVRRFAEQKEKLREDLEGWFSRPNS